MMERDTVPAAMSAAFEAAKGDLAARLMAALQAAQGEGGDVRGRQSAALLVVPPEGEAWRPASICASRTTTTRWRARAAARLWRAYELAGAADELMAADRADEAARCTGAPPSWRRAPTSCCSGRGSRWPTPATSTRASPPCGARPRSSRTGSCCSTGSRRTSPRPAARRRALDSVAQLSRSPAGGSRGPRWRGRRCWARRRSPGRLLADRRAEAADVARAAHGTGRERALRDVLVERDGVASPPRACSWPRRSRRGRPRTCRRPSPRRTARSPALANSVASLPSTLSASRSATLPVALVENGAPVTSPTSTGPPPCRPSRTRRRGRP